MTPFYKNNPEPPLGLYEYLKRGNGETERTVFLLLCNNAPHDHPNGFYTLLLNEKGVLVQHMHWSSVQAFDRVLKLVVKINHP